MRLVVGAMRTILWAIAFYSGTLVLLLLAALVYPVSFSGFQALVRLWSGWQRGTAYWLLDQRVCIDGVIPRGMAFFVFKHEAMFETIDLPWLLDRPMVFAKEELGRLPIWGMLASRYGLIFIARDAGAKTLRRMRKAGQDAVAANRPLVLLPEGTRVAHGDAPPIKSGFAGIYKMLDMAVVPVAVDTGRLRHGWIRLPGVITYRVGETVPPGLDRDVAEARVHAAINALNATANR